MTSVIQSGTVESKTEPYKGQAYEVLSSPSVVTIDFIPRSLFTVVHDGISETSVLVRVADLRAIRLPLDANPRLPEHLPVVDEIQASATGTNASRFVFMNNGIDIFCQRFEETVPPVAGNPGTLRATFGGPEQRDGICNGGVTYYALQKISALSTDPLVKLRFYQFEGATLELKASIAQAKNTNRAVSSTDDANFMGYFERFKEKLGELSHLIKWTTGDTEVISGDTSPIGVANYIRYLTALKLGETWHWALNTTPDAWRSHSGREDLLRNAGVHAKRFIANMSGEEE